MGLKYKGEGAFVPGIPARDLTDEEEQALTADERKAIAAAGIYEAPAKAKAAATTEGG